MRINDTTELTDFAESLYDAPDRFNLHGKLTTRQRRALGGRLFRTGTEVAWKLGVLMDRKPHLFVGVPFTGKQHMARRLRVLELRRLRRGILELYWRTNDTLLEEESAMNRDTLAILNGAEQQSGNPFSSTLDELRQRELAAIRAHLKRRFRDRPRRGSKAEPPPGPGA